MEKLIIEYPKEFKQVAKDLKTQATELGLVTSIQKAYPKIEAFQLAMQIKGLEVLTKILKWKKSKLQGA